MKKDLKEVDEKEKRLIEDERKRAREELIAEGKEANATIIMAKYKLDERLKVDKEVDPPPKNLYIGLGWDEFKGQNRKHYRQYYNDELENNREIFPTPSPFNSYSLTKGQSRGASKGMFSNTKTDESGNASTIQEAGIFKGIIEVENPKDKADYMVNKNLIIETLKKQINGLSIKITKKPFQFDFDKLSSAVERAKFD